MGEIENIIPDYSHQSQTVVARRGQAGVGSLNSASSVSAPTLARLSDNGISASSTSSATSSPPVSISVSGSNDNNNINNQAITSVSNKQQFAGSASGRATTNAAQQLTSRMDTFGPGSDSNLFIEDPQQQTFLGPYGSRASYRGSPNAPQRVGNQNKQRIEFSQRSGHQAPPFRASKQTISETNNPANINHRDQLAPHKLKQQHSSLITQTNNNQNINNRQQNHQAYLNNNNNNDDDLVNDDPYRRYVSTSGHSLYTSASQTVFNYHNPTTGLATTTTNSNHKNNLFNSVSPSDQSTITKAATKTTSSARPHSRQRQQQQKQNNSHHKQTLDQTSRTNPNPNTDPKLNQQHHSRITTSSLQTTTTPVERGQFINQDNLYRNIRNVNSRIVNPFVNDLAG